MSDRTPSAANEGLLGSVASGYALAWTARRLLSAVLLPVVAASLLGSSLLDLMLGEDRLVIVDGVAGFRDAGPLAWAKLATTVAFWLVALTAGASAVTRDTGPLQALRKGLIYLPLFAIGLIAAAGCLLLALWGVTGVATGRFALVLIVGVLVVAAFVVVRVLLSGIAQAVGGSGRMPSWTEAGSFLLGGVAAPVLLAYLLDRSGAGGLPYAGALVDAVLMIVVLAVQVGLAARPHPRDPAERRPARLWPGIASVTAAVLVSGGVVMADPYGAPSVRTQDRAPSGPVAVAWPAGQHPVIVTTGGVWFCDDDLCETVSGVNGGPPTIDGYGTAGIASDGTVVKTAVTGGPDKGGPFVHYARCVRDGCRQAWLPVRTTAAEQLDLRREARVELAGAAAPDGALWFFVATPIGGGELGRYRFSLIRCADVACATPQRHQVGTADRTPADGYPAGRRARLSVGADGRPVGSFWLGFSVYRYSCDPVTCAHPRESTDDAAPPDAIWDATGERAVSLRAGELSDGTGSALITGETPALPGALVVAGPFVYVAAALSGTPERGLRLTIGEPKKYWRQTVWRCAGLQCVSSPMDLYDGTARHELLAVADDGRVLVVRDDRIVLLETPLPAK